MRSIQIVAYVMLAVGANDLFARHPVQLTRYRFVADESQLLVTGGFAGVEERYAVRGTFDLFFDPFPHEDLPLPSENEPGVPLVQFVNVDAKLNGPPTMDGRDLDEVLKMSSWDGTLSDWDPGLAVFRGVDAQDAPIRATAHIGDVAFRLQGRNDPPCCDFFELDFDLFAQATSFLPPGDYNYDGYVDHADYDVWYDTFGKKTGVGAGADGNGNGQIDAPDYTVWKDHVGISDSLTAHAVPEPASLSAVFAVVVVATLRVSIPSIGLLRHVRSKE